MKMKKLLIALMMVLMAFSVAACSSDSDSSSESDEEKTEASDSGTLGDYEVSIKSCQVVTDYDGNSAVAITYDFTNNSDEATSFGVACTYTVFQDGVELDYTSVYLDEDSFTMMDDDVLTDIQPGKSIEVVTTHKLNDTSNPVTVEVEELASLDGDKLTKTFDIA